MKPKYKRSLHSTTLAVSICLTLASVSHADTLFWDGDATGATGNPPTGAGGNGTWEPSTDATPNWWNGSAYQTWDATGGQDIAEFRSANTYTVTVNGTIPVKKLNFFAGNAATFNNGSLNLGATGSIDFYNTTAHIFNSPIEGVVTMTGTGATSNLSNTTSVFINSNNTLLTASVINFPLPANHIVLNHAGALGAAGADVKVTKGILNLGNSVSTPISYNAWDLELNGGALRGRFNQSTINGPVTLTANSELLTRDALELPQSPKLVFTSAATVSLGANTLSLHPGTQSAGIELNGNISGTGAIIQATSALAGAGAAAGTTNLGGSNSYEGGTTINVGTLTFLKTASKPATGTVTAAAGATLGLGVGSSPTYFTSTDIDAAFADTLAGVTLNATSNIGIDTTAGDFTYATSITGGTRGLSKLGANKLTLSGTNTYTGPTLITAGSLGLSGTGTVGTGALTLAGGQFDLASQSANVGLVSITKAASSGSTITAGSLTTSGTTATAYSASNTSGNAIVAANLLPNGSAGFTKTGAGGIVSLSGTNSYTGGTTVTTGTLVYLNTAAKPATGNTTVAAAATIGLGVGASPTNFTESDVTALLAGTLTNVPGTNAYTAGIDTTAGDFTYSTNLGPSTRAIAKLGANTLTFSGTNTYDKLITVVAGTVKAGSSAAFNNTGTITVTGSSTFDLGGFDAKFTNVTNSTGTFTTTGAGAGTDTLTISALTATNGNLFTDNGTRKLAVSVAGSNVSPISNVANTFSGGLLLGNLMRLTPLDGTIGTPGAIVSGPFGRGPITVNGGSTNANGAQIWFNAANRTIVNDIIVNGNAGNGSRSGTFRVQTSGCGISGNVNANATPAWFGCDASAGATFLLSGQLTGAEGFRFFISNGSNAWTATLNNATANPNDYAGSTLIDSAATTLALGAANQIPNGTGKGNVSVTGTLDLAGFNETINGLSGAGTVDNVAQGTANTLTIGDGDATGTTFSGVIQNTNGTLSLVKTGTGTQTLSGLNTYEGTTAINAGTLSLGTTGSFDNSSSLTIAAGATLDASQLTTYGLFAGQPVTIGLDGTGTGSSGKINAAELDITNAAVTFSIASPLNDAVYVIANYTTKVGAAFASVTAPSGYNIDYAYNSGTQIALVQIAAPAGYASWASTNNVVEGPNGDDDKDGISNLVEYALGLTPLVSNPSPGTLSPTNVLTFNKGSEAVAAGDLTYSIETSTTLAPGSWSPVAPSTNDGTKIEYTLPTGVGGKVFGRLKVVK